MTVSEFKAWIAGYISGLGGAEHADIKVILEKIKDLRANTTNKFEVKEREATGIPNVYPNVWGAPRMDYLPNPLMPPYEIIC